MKVVPLRPWHAGVAAVAIAGIVAGVVMAGSGPASPMPTAAAARTSAAATTAGTTAATPTTTLLRAIAPSTTSASTTTSGSANMNMNMNMGAAPGQYVLADPQVTGVAPSTYNPPHAYFHEFQANCAVTENLPDDPIVFSGKPGASHMHTFMGNRSTNAYSTLASLQAGTSSCKVPADKSGYWMPALYNGTTLVDPTGPQVIYYKTGVNDYTSVRPFPLGLRFVVASPMDTANQFQNSPGYVAGFECGNSYHNITFPAWCPPGSELNVRFQAPSCWDGRYLDTPDHKSHMAYPVNGVCPADHPVALPMIEFKMAWPVSGDMTKLHFSSGASFSFHYDFFDAWDPATLAAMVKHCIDGGLQCDAQGYDQHQPGAGAALTAAYTLP
jgi:hypothetical protein